MNYHLHSLFRILLQDKVYSAINMAGLALGIACFIILALYLRHDLSYDSYHSKRDRIYRVEFEWSSSTSTSFGATSSRGLGPLLARIYPEVEEQAHFRKVPEGRVLLTRDELSNYEEGFYIGDNSVFRIFDFDILYGDPGTALTEPNTLAINESLARRYFGVGNPVGKKLLVNGESYAVALVFADLPDSSHLKYGGLIANAGDLVPKNVSMWSVGDGFTYVLLREGNENLGFRQILPNFFEDHMAANTRAGGYSAKLFIDPLADVHLYSTTTADLPRGNVAYLYAFSAVAFFVLLVACINYVNLATSRASKRSKEISMRKILGASRTQLITQYLSESLVFSLLALFVAIILVKFLLHFAVVDGLFGKQLELNLWGSGMTWLALLALGLGIGLLAGLYPAIYLSTMGTQAIAHKQYKTGDARLREALVLVQFTVSISVIAATLLMYLQMRYVDSKPLGFAKENRLSVDVYGVDAIERLPTMMNELKKQPNILGVSRIVDTPWKNPSGAAIEIPEGDGLRSMEVSLTQIDGNFLDTMNIALLTGRNLGDQRDKPAATERCAEMNVLVNQSLVQRSPWQDENDAAGKFFKISCNRFNVVGVVKDFHFNDLHRAIGPFFMVIDPLNFTNMNELAKRRAHRKLLVNIAGDDLPRTLSFLQETLRDLNPNRPVELKFVDETVNDLYLSDQRQMRLIGIFAVICVVISCLGLFGLTAFTTQKRTKEIGIRKTLGATAWQLILMLFKKISLLIVVGALIASFVAYFGIQFWLEGFYYRDDINFLVFPLATIAAVLVAFITVALQACKTALANPSQSLRYE